MWRSPSLRVPFWGARGNSGVILSQLLRGFADGVAGSVEIDSAHAVAAFRSATDSAYGAVSQPREGTMLSVIRGASDASVQANDAGEQRRDRTCGKSLTPAPSTPWPALLTNSRC